MGLDDDDSLLKHASHSSNPIQELLRIIEDAPSAENPISGQSQINNSMCASARRGGRAGIPSRLDHKGKTKKFL